MLSKLKIANKSFKRSQRRKKRLAVRKPEESFEQYTKRKVREQKSNIKRKEYAADNNDL